MVRIPASPNRPPTASRMPASARIAQVMGECMNVAGNVLLAVSGALTLWCWVLLWRGRDPLSGKAVWTVVSAVPMLGSLLFAGMHDAPPVQDEVDRARGLPLDSIDGPPQHHPHDH